MVSLWISTCAVFQLQQKQAYMSKDINEETSNVIDMNCRAFDKKKKAGGEAKKPLAKLDLANRDYNQQDFRSLEIA